jgi:putative addiction module component (TIGR02574 family)
MAPETSALLTAVLALPEVERALLVEHVLESLPGEIDALSDDELEAELDRRFDEFQNDPSVAVPWSEIKRAQPPGAASRTAV